MFVVFVFARVCMCVWMGDSLVLLGVEVEAKSKLEGT